MSGSSSLQGGGVLRRWPPQEEALDSEVAVPGDGGLAGGDQSQPWPMDDLCLGNLCSPEDSIQKNGCLVARDRQRWMQESVFVELGIPRSHHPVGVAGLHRGKGPVVDRQVGK